MNKVTHSINVGKNSRDYATFKKVFDEYCRSEVAVHRKDGKTVEWVNKKIKNARLHFKKDFVYLTIRFECKHYGTYERKSR